MPENVKIERTLKYFAHELPEKWHMEQVGTASAKMIKGDLDSLYALDVSLVK